MVKADRVGLICCCTLCVGMGSAQAVCLFVCLSVWMWTHLSVWQTCRKFATCHNKVCRVYGMSLSPKVGKGQHL